jgi:hypothetical protein
MTAAPVVPGLGRTFLPPSLVGFFYGQSSHILIRCFHRRSLNKLTSILHTLARSGALGTSIFSTVLPRLVNIASISPFSGWHNSVFRRSGGSVSSR